MITCRDVNRLVTDYFEGAMGLRQRMGFKMHLAMCRDCKTHLGKMRQMIDALGHIPPDTEVPDEMLKRLNRFISK